MFGAFPMASYGNLRPSLKNGDKVASKMGSFLRFSKTLIWPVNRLLFSWKAYKFKGKAARTIIALFWVCWGRKMGSFGFVFLEQPEGWGDSVAA